MSCHTSKSCTRAGNLRAQGVSEEKDPGNCIACHMPKRDVRVISHASVTSHRILARADEAFPEEAFQQTTPALPDLIHLDPNPNGTHDSIAPITLLQAYGELSAAEPNYNAAYLAVLDKLEQTAPDQAIVQASLGRRDLLNGNFQQAANHLQRALELGPPQAAVFGDLAEATFRAGSGEKAVTQLEKGIELDPFNPVLQKTLTLRLIGLKRYPEALAAIEKYLDRFPQDSTMRKALEMARRAPTQP
jgi:tetratricopeptide (TPR) repeat protein